MQRLGRPIISFLLSVLVGMIVFLVTNNPFAGALFPAVRAGWEAFRSGWWILNADQNIVRARICAAFCMASAFWQAATAMLVSVFVFVAVANLGGGAPDMQLVAITMTILAGGVVLTSLVGLMAATAATRSGIRVWVNPQIRIFTGQDVAAIATMPGHIYFNHAVFVLGTSVALPVILTCGWLLVEFQNGWITAAVIVLGFAFPMAGYGWFASRILAASPADCWRFERTPSAEG